MLSGDPTPSLKKSAKDLYKSWRPLGFFEGVKTNRSLGSEVDCSNLSEAYGLIKAHKQGYPARIVVSTIESPFSVFDKTLSILLERSCKLSEFSIKNSAEFKDRLSRIKIPSGYKLVSFDIVNMFSNLPFSLIIKRMREQWKHMKHYTKVPKDEFLMK